MTAPTSEPTETFEQIASIAREMLPGVKIRRGLFWRYTAVWVRSVDKMHRNGKQYGASLQQD